MILEYEPASEPLHISVKYSQPTVWSREYHCSLGGTLTHDLSTLHTKHPTPHLCCDGHPETLHPALFFFVFTLEPRVE